MLSKKYSIAKSKFDVIFKRSKSVGSKYFIVRYMPNNKSYSQFAVIVSKKTHKLAVKRNYTKRIVKIWIYENLDDIKKGYYYLITVKKNIQKDSKLQQLLKQDLLNNFKKIS